MFSLSNGNSASVYKTVNFYSLETIKVNRIKLFIIKPHWENLRHCLSFEQGVGVIYRSGLSTYIQPEIVNQKMIIHKFCY